MWIISWRWNGKAYMKEYDTYRKAEPALYRLIKLGFDPSLHVKGVENEKSNKS